MPRSDGTALKMSCPFTNTTLQRVSFERKVNLDLSRASAITFDFYCDDPTAVGKCLVYFHTGDGWWYSGLYAVARGRQFAPLRTKKSRPNWPALSYSLLTFYVSPDQRHHTPRGRAVSRAGPHFHQVLPWRCRCPCA